MLKLDGGPEGYNTWFLVPGEQVWSLDLWYLSWSLSPQDRSSRLLESVQVGPGPWVIDALSIGTCLEAS